MCGVYDYSHVLCLAIAAKGTGAVERIADDCVVTGGDGKLFKLTDCGCDEGRINLLGVKLPTDFGCDCGSCCGSCGGVDMILEFIEFVSNLLTRITVGLTGCSIKK